MKKTVEKSIQDLLTIKDDQFSSLHRIVADSIKEQQLISHRLRKDLHSKVHFGEKLADKVASFGGSWKFIIIFCATLIAWIILNSFIIYQRSFDPYPYILLNLLLSCLAALQAPVILMSQNRQEAKDRKRAEHDYVINLKAELEIRSLHQKIDMLIVEHVEVLVQMQKEQLVLLKDILESNSKK